MAVFRALHVTSGVLRRHLCCSEVKILYFGNGFINRVPTRTHMFAHFKPVNARDFPMIHIISDEEASQFLQNLDEDYKKKLDFLKIEHQIFLERGGKVPKTVTDKQWIRLLQTESRTGFRKRLEIYFKKEFHKESRILRKQEAEKTHSESNETEDVTTLENELEDEEKHEQTFKNSILRRIPHNLATFKPRLITSLQYGNPLIIDFDYTDFMRRYETSVTARQIGGAFSLNRVSGHPFNLIFCNTGKGQILMNELLTYLNLSDENDILATTTKKHYLDLYSRDKLVYLSPDSDNILRKFDPTDVYIIGAFVDTFDPSCKISIKRAQNDGIRHARIAVDKYLKVTPNINFTIDQMIKFMLYCKENMSVEEALKRSFPKRKQIAAIPTKKYGTRRKIYM